MSLKTSHRHEETASGMRKCIGHDCEETSIATQSILQCKHKTSLSTESLKTCTNHLSDKSPHLKPNKQHRCFDFATNPTYNTQDTSVSDNQQVIATNANNTDALILQTRVHHGLCIHQNSSHPSSSAIKSANLNRRFDDDAPPLATADAGNAP